MMRIQRLIEQLKSRIPELEWKISQLSANKSLWRLPRGVFRLKAGSPYLDYVLEIKKDLLQLESQQNSACQHHLAKQIENKISLLVRISLLQGTKNKTSTNAKGVIQRLSTRQQWLQDLNLQITKTTQQIAALKNQLSNRAIQKDTQAQLQLEHDIGQACEQLTLLQERYQRMSSDKSNDSRP